MKIGELSRKSGLSPSAIRFYEEQGLLLPASRTASGYREYTANAMHRLHLIQVSKRLGFSLDIIRELFGDNGQCSKARTLDQTNIRLREVEAQQLALAQQHSDLVALRAMLENGSFPSSCSSNFAVN